MGEFGGGSYLTVKIGIISTTIPVLMLWMGATLWLSLASQWLLGFALWHCVWDYVYPPKPDAKSRTVIQEASFVVFNPCSGDRDDPIPAVARGGQVWV